MTEVIRLHITAIRIVIAAVVIRAMCAVLVTCCITVIAVISSTVVTRLLAVVVLSLLNTRFVRGERGEGERALGTPKRL